MKGRAMAVLARRTARGVSAGLAAGVLWWIVECAALWALGGTPDGPAALVILGLDLAFGAVGGALVGVVTGAESAAALALGLTVVYGFLRVYEPPGLRAELLFAVLAPIGAFVGLLIA